MGTSIESRLSVETRIKLEQLKNSLRGKPKPKAATKAKKR